MMKEGKTLFITVNYTELINRNGLALCYFFLLNLKRCVVNVCNFV